MGAGLWAAEHKLGPTRASSVTVSLPTAMPGGTALVLAPGGSHTHVPGTSPRPLLRPKSQHPRINPGKKGAGGEQAWLALLGDAEEQKGPLLSPGAGAAPR